MANFSIKVNGESFELWKSATVIRSVDENAGSFRLISTYAPDGVYPIDVGDSVEVLINGITKIKGFVDEISSSADTTDHTIDISGRDNTSDLIDSSLPIRTFKGDISFKNLCETIIRELGANIQVIDQSNIDLILSEEQLSGDTGDTCMEFLMSFARKRNIFLVPSGDGNLILFRPVFEEADTPLLNLEPNNPLNNIKSRNWRKSSQNLFYKYSVKSQDNVGFDLSSDYSEGNGTNRTGEVIDDSIRQTRFFEIVSEESMTDTECKNRSSEESNIRRTRSQEYTAVVPGVSQQSGNLWDFGLVVTIRDEPAGISGKFFIRSVTYHMSKDEGSRTTIVCAPPDAYKMTSVPSPLDDRKFNFSTIFESF